MLSKIFAKQYLLETLTREIGASEQEGEIFVNKNSKIENFLHGRNIQNLINHLSTHKLRQTLMFYLKLDNLYIPQYTEKAFALDFLNYTILNNPYVPLDIFPKKDHGSIISFIKNKYLIAISSGVAPNKLFSKKDLREQKRIEHFNERNNHRHFLKGYNITGFKTRNINLTPNIFIYKEGVKYLNKAKKLKGSTIIDCGACDGDSSWLLNKEIGPSKIISIEPEIDNYKKLIRNIELNGLSSVTPLRIGVGKQKKAAHMKAGQGGSATVTNTGNKIKIDTIDNISKDLKLKNIGLIKMDIEGYEYDAIKGAQVTIQKYRPTLLISIYHRGQDFFEIPFLLKEFVPRYKFRFVNLDYQKATLERSIIAEYIG